MILESRKVFQEFKKKLLYRSNIYKVSPLLLLTYISLGYALSYLYFNDTLFWVSVTILINISLINNLETLKLTKIKSNFNTTKRKELMQLFDGIKLVRQV